MKKWFDELATNIGYAILGFMLLIIIFGLIAKLLGFK